MQSEETQVAQIAEESGNVGETTAARVEVAEVHPTAEVAAAQKETIAEKTDTDEDKAVSEVNVVVRKAEEEPEKPEEKVPSEATAPAGDVSVQKEQPAEEAVAETESSREQVITEQEIPAKEEAEPVLPEEENSDDETVDEDHSGENTTDEESSDEDYTEEESSDEDYSDEESSDEDYTDEESSDEDYTDEESSDEDYTEEESSDENYADEEYPDGEDSDGEDSEDEESESETDPTEEETYDDDTEEMRFTGDWQDVQTGCIYMNVSDVGNGCYDMFIEEYYSDEQFLIWQIRTDYEADSDSLVYVDGISYFLNIDEEGNETMSDQQTSHGTFQWEGGNLRWEDSRNGTSCLLKKW